MKFLAVLISFLLFVRVYGKIKKDNSSLLKHTSKIVGYIVVNDYSYQIYDGKSISYTKHVHPLELLRVECRGRFGWTVNFIYWWRDIKHQKILNEVYRVSNKTLDWTHKTGHVLHKKLQYRSVDNHYEGITCELIDKDTLQNSITHILMAKTYVSEDPAVFVVNNLTVYPTQSLEENLKNLQFHYEFYDGEEIHLILKTDRRVYRNVACSFFGFHASYPKYGKVFVIRKNQNYLKLICTLSSTSLSFQATITFKHDSFTYEPYITGLSLSKTLQKNKIDKRVTNINYEYSPSDILRLKCDTDYVTYKLEWHFTREDMVAHQIDHVVSSDGALHMNQIEGVFQLAPHVKSTLISCILLKDKEEYITNLHVIRTESMRGEARLNETDRKLNDPWDRRLDQIRLVSNAVLDPIPEGGYRYNGSVNYFYMQSNVEKEIANKIEGNTTSTSTNRTTIIPTRRTTAIPTRRTTAIPTRRTTAIPTRGTTIIPTNTTTEENISDGKHSNSSAKHRDLGTEYDPSGIIVIVIIFVIIFCAFIAIVTIICVRICRARKRKETEQVYENAMVLMDVNEDRASTTSSHIYESISEPEPQDQIRAAHSTATSAAKDISQRPTIPSEEESEDCKPYIHYDTPYEFRIFRMGVPVVKVPDRFRSRRGRF